MFVYQMIREGIPFALQISGRMRPAGNPDGIMFPEKTSECTPAQFELFSIQFKPAELTRISKTNFAKYNAESCL